MTTKGTNTFCVVSEAELRTLKALNKNAVYPGDLEVLMEEGVLKSITKIITKFQYAQKLRLITGEMQGNESKIYDGVEMLESLKKEFGQLEKSLEDYVDKMNEKKVVK